MSTHDDAFLADVIAHPRDDAPRLVYADWLEDNGRAERAEFIRVQCELARMDREAVGPGGTVSRSSPWRQSDPGLRRLQHREGWLLSFLRPALTAELPPSLPHCHAWGLYLARHDDGIDDDFTVGMGRGFAATVTLPCAAWLAHGPALVRAAPLEVVRLTDRQPYPVDGDSRRRHFWADNLPTGLFATLVSDDVQPVAHPAWKRYPGRAEALAALSEACLAWASAQPGPGPTAMP